MSVLTYLRKDAEWIKLFCIEISLSMNLTWELTNKADILINKVYIHLYHKCLLNFLSNPQTLKLL